MVAQLIKSEANLEIPEIGKNFLEGGTYQLIDYQKKVIGETYRFFRIGLKSVLIYAPTGSGKTVIGSKMIVDSVNRGRRVLFLVHRSKLVQQTVNILRESGINPSVIWADWPEPPDYNNQVQIAMIQTLNNRELPEDIGLVILDEAHTSSYYKVYSKVMNIYSGGILPLSPCFFVGLTASPWRKKRVEGYCQFFQAMVRAPHIQKLIDLGRLARSRQFGYDGLIDFKKLDTKDGEYTQRSMDAECGEIYNEAVIKHYLECCPERKAIAFCTGVKQAILLTEQLIAVGKSAECIIESTSSKKRDEIYDRFHTGETNVLVSVGVLTEGYDEKTIECVILARPTKSRALLVQMCGRGLRLSPKTGKVDCYFLDFGENFKRLGYHTKKFKTQLCPKTRIDGEMLTKTCPYCNAVIPIVLRICPHCGFEFIGDEDDIPDYKPFGELLTKEQKDAARYIRKYIRQAYWKKKDLAMIQNADLAFQQKYNYQPPADWSADSIFQGDHKKQLYNHQVYVRFLRRSCKDPEQSADWINEMMRREFGIYNERWYIPWWRLLGEDKPIHDPTEIKRIYHQKASDFVRQDHAEEKLALLSLGMSEALGLDVKVGDILDWIHCPPHLNWMNPFKIISINKDTRMAQIQATGNSNSPTLPLEFQVHLSEFS